MCVFLFFFFRFMKKMFSGCFVVVLAIIVAFIPAAQATAPDHFLVRFITNVANSSSTTTTSTTGESSSSAPTTGGVIELNVTRAWAPLGADHFWELLHWPSYSTNGSSYYNGAAFFRVVPNFVVQFGIAGTPAWNSHWAKPILDDPVFEKNLAGTVSYATAGKNTRTTQLFINLVDNSFLDNMGFAPFATVTKGMDIVKQIYNPTPKNSGGVSQQEYTAKGDEWILKEYPKINMIIKTELPGVKTNPPVDAAEKEEGGDKKKEVKPEEAKDDEKPEKKKAAGDDEGKKKAEEPPQKKGK